MNDDFKMLNQIALRALEQNKIYQAQSLFRENAKKNPGYLTFNNLGVFYVFEGLFNQNDLIIRRGVRLGINYLKKAQVYKKTFFTFLALGHAFFKIEDYDGAIESFEQAYMLRSDYESAYNLANSFYRKGVYKEAVKWFKRSVSLCNSSEYAMTYSAFLFSLLMVNKDKCHEKIINLLEDKTSYFEYDKFIIAYLCGDMEMAEKQIKPMFEKFDLGIDVIAMAIDCLFILNKHEQAKKYLEYELENCEYYTQFEIKKIKKVFSHEDYRKKIISSFVHIIPVVDIQCCYFGCKLHSNPD